MPANASPEVQQELRRQWALHQQQQQLLAQANSQGLRQGAPGVGRGLLIPGGPNGRPMPIRPNTGTPIPGTLPLRLPGAATPEQMQQMLAVRQQQAMGNQGPGVAQSPQQIQQRMAQARALQAAQAAQLSAAQAAGQAPANAGPDYIPFIGQTNAGATQGTVSQIVC
jgi:hypothetical protein